MSELTESGRGVFLLAFVLDWESFLILSGESCAVPGRPLLLLLDDDESPDDVEANWATNKTVRNPKRIVAYVIKNLLLQAKSENIASFH